MNMSISFTGLASGFDSGSYIDAIMKQESIPLTKLQTKKSNAAAYQKIFKSLNTKLATLKDAATALKDATSFKLTRATSSDTSKLSVTAGDNSVTGNYQVNVTQLAQQQVAASKSFNITDTGASLPDSITVNGNTIDLTDLKSKTMDEVLSTVRSRINALGMGVNAAVVQTSATTQALTLTSAQAGQANSFTFSTTDYFGFVEKQAAKDATLQVNGIDVTSSTNEVKNAVPGATLQLTGTGTSTVNVSQDADKIADKVQTFVTAYNDIIKTIRDNTQKSTKNADGSLSLTLQGDSTLRDLQSQMNNMLNGLFGDKAGYKLMSDLGLEVDKGVTSAALMTGELSFDKDTFKSKLAADPDTLQQMFTGTDPSYDGFGKKTVNFLKVWTDSVNGVITTKVKGYDDDISFIDDAIENMQTRLDMKEASLKKQYANLEVVMSSLNNQKSWMSSQLSALTAKSSS
ncbi:flagellar filament capping protein FliD [Paenibacillus caui]|uniref:flagellar filament capping protein FliD n=1 Tax=Paenibacillus caui TaxID=2873927 RepID=UPI001CA9EBA1|nr:flagellar filament capping protein FliD [Paenibacillus caui]